MDTLVQIAGDIRICTGCLLCKTRNHTVPGVGHPSARLFVLGEAPGEQEDSQGLPFVGRAGELLNEGLAYGGFCREEVFISNAVKCRPPGNRNPSPDELEACSPFLIWQLRQISPDLILVLGKVAAEHLLQRSVAITKEAGQLDFTEVGWPVLLNVHPAYVLRRTSPELLQQFREVFSYARILLEGPR